MRGQTTAAAVVMSVAVLGCTEEPTVPRPSLSREAEQALPQQRDDRPRNHPTTIPQAFCIGPADVLDFHGSRVSESWNEMVNTLDGLIGASFLDKSGELGGGQWTYVRADTFIPGRGFWGKGIMRDYGRQPFLVREVWTEGPTAISLEAIVRQSQEP